MIILLPPQIAESVSCYMDCYGIIHLHQLLALVFVSTLPNISAVDRISFREVLS